MKRRISSLNDLRKDTKAGMPYQSFKALCGKLGVDHTEAEVVLRIPPWTLVRRRNNQRLRADESERVVRFTRIVSQVTAVFGNKANAAEWLRRPNRALGGIRPLELVNSDHGIRQINGILARIAHGMVS